MERSQYNLLKLRNKKKTHKFSKSRYLDSQVPLASSKHSKDDKSVNRTLFIRYIYNSHEKKLEKVLKAVIKPKPIPRYSHIPYEDRVINRLGVVMGCSIHGKRKILLLKTRNSDSLEYKEARCSHPICSYCNKYKIKKERAYLSDTIRRMNTRKIKKFMTLSWAEIPYGELTHERLLQIGREFDDFKKYNGRRRDRSYYINQVANSGSPQERKDRQIQNMKLFMPEHSKLGLNYSLGIYGSVLHIEFNEKGSPRYDRKDKKTILGYYEQDNWNVNQHIVYDGDYIPVEIAREFFKAATNNKSMYVHIEAASDTPQDTKDTVNYLTGYLCKRTFNNPRIEVMIEYYNAIKGIKFIRYSEHNSKKYISKFEILRSYCMKTLGMALSDYFTLEVQLLCYTLKCEYTKVSLDLMQFDIYKTAKQKQESEILAKIR